MIKSNKTLSFWLIVLPTWMLFYVALWLTINLRYPKGLSHIQYNAHLQAFTIIYLLWLLAFFSFKIFEFNTLRRYTTLFFSLLSAMVANLLLAVIYFYLQPNLILTPRRFLLLDTLLSFLLVLLWYLLVKYFFKFAWNEKIYLFSFNRELEELEKEIADQDFLGFRVKGHLNDQSLSTFAPEGDESIILPPNLHSSQETLSKFYALRNRGVTFYNYDDFYEKLLRRVFLSQLSELWFLENIEYRQKPFYVFAKRVLDMIFGFLMFIVFVITFPFIFVASKLSGLQNTFFIQERVGQNGKLFKVYKYRTMKGETTDTWTEKNDPRITSVGKFLRKTRLDELPQFINLIQGNMSLVGPRPEQVGIVAKLKEQIPFYGEREAVKPGLTGWGQLNVYASSVEETKLKLQYDLYYIKYRSFFFDLEIIFKTIYHIFTGSGR